MLVKVYKDLVGMHIAFTNRGWLPGFGILALLTCGWSVKVARSGSV